MKGYIVVNEKDSVATTSCDFKKDEEVANIGLLNDIANGHKFTLKDIKKDEIIIKYAEVIASASCDISTGGWVHTCSTAGTRGRGNKE